MQQAFDEKAEKQQKQMEKAINEQVNKRLASAGAAGGTVKRRKLTKPEKFNVNDEQHQAAFMDRVKLDTARGGKALPGDIIDVMFKLERMLMDVSDVRAAMEAYYISHTTCLTISHNMPDCSIIGISHAPAC